MSLNSWRRHALQSVFNCTLSAVPGSWNWQPYLQKHKQPSWSDACRSQTISPQYDPQAEKHPPFQSPRRRCEWPLRPLEFVLLSLANPLFTALITFTGLRDGITCPMIGGSSRQRMLARHLLQGISHSGAFSQSAGPGQWSVRANCL